ncbi:MAG: hypothetical protein Q9195_002704 [Heterodermia aff. obscurata]
MPPFKERLESFVGGLLSSVRGHDASLFTQSAPFKDHPEPTITITAPESGPSGSELKLHHTPLGENRFPELHWKAPSNAPVVAEYLVMVEDPDAPLPSPVVHGVYYSIPASRNSLLPSDFEKIGGEGDLLSGGFKYGANRMKSVWGGPRPVMGHGVHRYMFQVVALSVKVEDEGGLLNEVPTKAELEKVVAGLVVMYGVNSLQDALANTEQYKNDPRNPALRRRKTTEQQ